MSQESGFDFLEALEKDLNMNDMNNIDEYELNIDHGQTMLGNPFMGVEQENFDKLVSETANNNDVKSYQNDPLSPCEDVAALETEFASLDVKLKLGNKIKQKFWASGKELPSTETRTDEIEYELTPEEKEKREAKRVRNKESARQSRQRKKDAEEVLKEENKALVEKNEVLIAEVNDLKKRLNTCEESMKDHKSSCRFQNNPFYKQDERDSVSTYKPTSVNQARSDCSVMWNKEDELAVNEILRLEADAKKQSVMQDSNHITTPAVASFATSVTKYPKPVEEAFFYSNTGNASPVLSQTDPDSFNNTATLSSSSEECHSNYIDADGTASFPVQVFQGSSRIIQTSGTPGVGVSVFTFNANTLTAGRSNMFSVAPSLNNPWCVESDTSGRDEKEIFDIMGFGSSDVDDYPPPCKKPRTGI